MQRTKQLVPYNSLKFFVKSKSVHLLSDIYLCKEIIFSNNKPSFTTKFLNRAKI